MSFNISDFSSRVNRYGTARNNLFHVRIVTPPCLRDAYSSDFYSRDLQFFCRSVDLPDMSIDAADVFHQGIGLPTHRPTGMTISPLNTVFMMDSEFRVKHFFHRWLQHIFNYNNDNPLGEVDGQLPFEIGYKSDYATTVSVTQFSNHIDDNFYTYNFLNAYPKTLGSISLSWDDQQSLTALPVSFVYDTCTPLGATPGNGTSERFARGTGLIQNYLNARAAYQSIRQFNQVTDIQDAVNRLTTVSNAIERIF